MKNLANRIGYALMGALTMLVLLKPDIDIYVQHYEKPKDIPTTDVKPEPRKEDLKPCYTCARIMECEFNDYVECGPDKKFYEVKVK